jgi:hypothetical protein
MLGRLNRDDDGNRVQLVSNCGAKADKHGGLQLQSKVMFGHRYPIEYPIGDVSERLRKQENPDAIGVFAMARPGLEPGTPRFSVKCTRIPNGAEIPAHRRVSAATAWRTKVRKMHEMVGDVGHEMPLVAQ